MSENNFSPKRNQNQEDTGSWVGIILLLFVFPPLGIALLVDKLIQTRRQVASRSDSSWRQDMGARPGGAASARPGAQPQARPGVRPGPQQAPGPQQRPGPAPFGRPAGHAAPQPGGFAGFMAARRAKSTASWLTTLGFFVALLAAFFLSTGFLLLTRPVELPGAVAMLVLGVFTAAGSIFSFISGGRWARREKRYKRFAAVIGRRPSITLAELSRTLGLPPAEAQEQLLDLIDRGFFGDTAYIDWELDSFVTSYEVAQALRQKAREAAAVQEDETAGASFADIISDMYRLRGSLTDAQVAQRFDRIIDLTTKIFLAVEKNPEKAERCRRFTSYYLPTTLKLLRSYASLESHGFGAEGTQTARQDIIRVLDSLCEGFQQQLDRLFSDERLDLRTEIQVLENMLRRDGLSGDEFGQTFPGGGV